MFEGDEMKVDLRKSRSTMVDQEVMDDGFILDSEKNVFAYLSKIDFKIVLKIVIRLVLCCAGTVVLMQVEKRNLQKLGAQRNAANNEHNQLKNNMQAVQKEIEGFDYLKGRSLEFTNKLIIMEGIVHRRLKVIRGLDQIQDVIPQNVWLERVNFNGNKLVLNGFSSTNKQVQTFIESMEKTNVFLRVVLDRVSEQGALKQKSFAIHVTLR